ncbi:MAG: hypothetical protein TU35_001750 [Thermoproteus sp. AZ2]|uniref:Uncharacterized protein n=1 Tax=Thermoproteus sp. AZ2 TaxID=1609232 RepID=A0ACC6UZT4_9CREN
MEPYCNFDVAVENVREMLLGLLSDAYTDMPQRELEAVLDIALRDFLHYLAYRFGLYLTPRFREDKARQRLCVRIVEHWDFVRRIAEDWVVMWSAKWRQRVKLVFTDEEFKKATEAGVPSKPNDNLEKFLSEIDHLGLQLFTVSQLIKAGELAGLDQIADYIIREEASAMLDSYGLEGALRRYREGELAKRIMARIQSMRKTSEPFLIIRVDITRVWGY